MWELVAGMELPPPPLPPRALRNGGTGTHLLAYPKPYGSLYVFAAGTRVYIHVYALSVRETSAGLSTAVFGPAGLFNQKIKIEITPSMFGRIIVIMVGKFKKQND